MNKPTKRVGRTEARTALPPLALTSASDVQDAVQEVGASFEKFCLRAGLDALTAMLEADVAALCGAPYARGEARQGLRWGSTRGEVPFHGGTVPVRRPRVRGRDGQEMELATWAAAQGEDLLGQWALNLMLINVATRRFARAVRLPGSPLDREPGDGTSKSAVSRRFVALSAAKMAKWMSADLSGLDLLVIQIDGLHVGTDHVMVAALGIDGNGVKHPLALVDGATENTATVQALLDDLVERGVDPGVCRLFIVDGAKALTRAIRTTFGKHTPIQRCQVHKARNILDRLPDTLRPSTKRVLRQAWELDDAAKAEQLIRNLARRLDQDGHGVAQTILEGLDEMLTVIRLGLPKELRHALGCTNAIENMMGTIRRVCRNVKRWRDTRMILRWTAAGLLEAKKGFRRLKAHKQVPLLRAALERHQARHAPAGKTAALAATTIAA
jgi:putative transposase